MLYKLEVGADPNDPDQNPQAYYADSLFGLLVQVVRHRFWHWRRGDGWRD